VISSIAAARRFFFAISLHQIQKSFSGRRNYT
jgi:hypothetical protein